jgi:hypothetical protein
MTKAKLTQGPNDRPKDATIAQTGSGAPDDTGKPLEIDDDEAARIEQNIRDFGEPDPGEAERKLKREVQQDIELPLKGSA